ncbi:MAG: protein kinase [candidate division Zixibacteria bacterium]|nr:protein kinase [candidate division Zixibacteria bacterium]
MEPDDDKTQSHLILTKDTMVLHYKIIEKIGAGGMGEVYLAEDTKLKRQVALKFLPSHLCQDEDCRKRFKREAQAAAGLDHPNIAAIFEVGEHQDRPFYSMQVVKGQTLKDVIAGKDLPVKRMLELGIQICEGLNDAHEKGVTHRDIKPSNILTDSHGRAKIVDFGLASVVGTDQLTKTGSTLGTIGYMSPEQVQGKEIDHRSDLFSLGVVLYELITKRNPFKRDSEAATLKAVSDDTPHPVARYRASVPVGVQAIIDKALEKDVKTRYQHADGMLSDLMRVKRSIDSGESTASVSATARRSSRIWWAAALVVVIAASVLIVTKPWRDDSISDKPDRIMLAVLPFENLGSADDEYFADAITDEITSRLGVIRGLGVISRTSAMQYKGTGKSLPEIADELGVDYVLEGTIFWDKKSDPERIRIIPQLILASDNTHLWADQYNRFLTDIFAVQTDIAAQIVNALDITLLKPERQKLDSKPTENIEAYGLYLRGIDYLRRGIGNERDLLSAVEMFEKAVDLDSSFALAFTSLSYAHTTLSLLSVMIEEHSQKAKEAIYKALQLAPSLPEAHLTLGYYHNLVEQDYDRALAEFEIARMDMANHSDLYSMIALVQKRQGEWNKSLANNLKAVTLDPRSAEKNRDVATGYLILEQYSEAEFYMDRSISLAPDNSFLYWAKLSLYLLWGNEKKARDVLEQLPENIEPADVLWYDRYFGVDGLGLWRFELTDQSPSQLAKRVSSSYSGSKRHAYYLSMAQIYDLMNQPDSSRVYYDSARTFIEVKIQEGHDDFHLHTDLGLVYAFLGLGDKAVYECERAMEMMPASSCHW